MLDRTAIGGDASTHMAVDNSFPTSIVSTSEQVVQLISALEASDASIVAHVSCRSVEHKVHSNSSSHTTYTNSTEFEGAPISTTSSLTHEDVRKSTIVSRHPMWLKDYVRPDKGRQSIHYQMFSTMRVYSPNMRVIFSIFLRQRSHNPTMKLLKTICGWKQCMQKSKHLDKKAIGCKCVYEIKYKANGEVERFKSRLVAKRYNQKEGLNYQETFFLIVKMVTVRSIISLAASRHWTVHHMDVYNAFLQGDLSEKVYMTTPQGFSDSSNKSLVCKLLKSLYGLKHAS
ncbi:uncharacterized protein [Nicotiana tomentosiformis]|uniref:uncharacterized protein n=1 Tax=Nicotiana tomentosiformis TaxID=4098 RepID=UPI00388C8904